MAWRQPAQRRPKEARPTQNCRPVALLVSLVLAGLGGCASVPRDAAVTLSQTGQRATSASQNALQGLSADVQQVAVRQLVRTALIQCAAQDAAKAKGPTAPPAAPRGSAVAAQPFAATAPCPVAELGEAGLAADRANQNLAQVILLRVKAVSALGDAYGAFADEAKYNARGELEAALGSLDAQVNTLTAGLQALGAPGLSLVAIEPLVNAGAGAFADRAQARRLRAASQRIHAALQALIKAMSAEADLYGQVAQPIADNRARVMDQLLASGVADPVATLAAFEAPLTSAPPKSLSADDRSAVAAARTIVRYQAQHDTATVAESYRLNIKTLQALSDAHSKFEAGQPLTLEAASADIDQLTGWVTAVKPLEQSQRGRTP